MAYPSGSAARCVAMMDCCLTQTSRMVPGELGELEDAGLKKRAHARERHISCEDGVLLSPERTNSSALVFWILAPEALSI